MAYEAKNFDHLLGTSGFSETMLKNHFALYQGYVKNVNGLVELLDTKEVGAPEYSELRRHFGWEFNGMRLHELYFDNMKNGGVELTKDGSLWKQMDADFGTATEESCADDFKATGAIRGIGWVVLYWDTVGKRLFNTWINEHDVGHLTGCVPLLVMDVFEHAYMTDYGIKRAGYITAFMNAIDWGVVEERFTHATK